MNPTQKMRYSWMAIIIGVLGVVIAGWRFFHRPSRPTDLSQGGVQLVYDIDLPRVADRRFAASLDRVVDNLRSANVSIIRVAPQPRSAVIAAPGLDAARLTAALGDSGLAAGPIASDGEVTLRLPDELVRSIEDAAMQQTSRVLHDRIEKLDWCVPRVQQSAGRFVVTLPGLEPGKLERVKEILGVGGRLEFREVDPGRSLAAAPLPEGSPVHHQLDHWSSSIGSGEAHYFEGPLAELEKVRSSLTLPGGVGALIEPSAELSRPPRLYLVQRRADVTGESIKEARAAEDKNQGGWRVDLELDDAGALAFRDLSSRLIGKKLAIVVDDQIQSSPVVQSKIDGGRLQITLGRGDPDHQRRLAENLALTLRAGALPAPLRLASERIVGPIK